MAPGGAEYARFNLMTDLKDTEARRRRPKGRKEAGPLASNRRKGGGNHGRRTNTRSKGGKSAGLRKRSVASAST
jgi:hypothetical protein